MAREKLIQSARKLYDSPCSNETLKEEKHVSKPKFYDSMDDLIADALIEEIEVSKLPESAKHNRIYWINKHRQKPAEWSEENIKREWWNKGYLEGRKNAHIPARELGLPSSWDFQQKPKEKSEKPIIPECSEEDKTIDQLAEEYVEGVKKCNDAPTWDLIHTAVCYGYELGRNAKKEE